MRRAAARLARLGEDAGRCGAALAAADRLVRRWPRLGWARFYRAGLLAASGRPVDALGDLAALAVLPPDALFGAGREPELPAACARAGGLAGVAALSRRAPKLAWARVLHAYALRLAGRGAESAAAMESALRLAPRDPVVLALAARVLYVNRMPARSTRLLEAARRLAPSCFWIAAWLGEARRYDGDLRGAMRLLDEALRRAPSYHIARSWRGGVRRALGRHAGAVADLDAAIRVEWAGDADRASLAWAYHERSLAKRARGDHAGALRDLRAAHRLNGRYVFVPADARRGLPSARASRAELTRLARGSLRAQALAWRGLSSASAGLGARALADLDESLRLAPRNAWARVWRAGAALDMGASPAAARRELDAALRRDPRYALAWLLRGKLELAAGRPRRAAADLSRARSLDPFSAAAWAESGRAAAALGRRKDAAAFGRRAAAIAGR